MKRLPKKLSDLILLALEDLEAAERNPRFKIDMKDWFHVKNATRYRDGETRLNHSLTSETAQCTVCFAGAVMAGSLNGVEKSLNLRDEGYMTPYDFGKNDRKLQALNSIRTGDVTQALEELGRARPKSFTDSSDEADGDVWLDFRWEMGDIDGLRTKNAKRRASSYEKDPKAWKQAVLSIVGILQAEGL